MQASRIRGTCPGLKSSAKCFGLYVLWASWCVWEALLINHYSNHLPFDFCGLSS